MLKHHNLAFFFSFQNVFLFIFPGASLLRLSFGESTRWGLVLEAARVRRPGVSMGRLTPPKESYGRTPPAVSVFTVAIAKEIYSARHM